MQLRRRDIQTVEMQMGPMIDMVFLLLVFFMVSAKPIRQESDLNIGLPGTVSQEETLDIPDEQRVTVRADGQILLNDLALGDPRDEALAALVGTLTRFKEASEANKAEALVTIDAEDGARHQRIVSVLNACARAGITGVTFADDPEEEP